METQRWKVSRRTCQIGFGCSLTSVGRGKALLLLETSFDAGIRHFDGLRYGYGETEAIVGTFIKSRRAQITVTSKFGIEPPRRTNTRDSPWESVDGFCALCPPRVRWSSSASARQGNAFSVADANRNLRPAFGNF